MHRGHRLLVLLPLLLRLLLDVLWLQTLLPQLMCVYGTAGQGRGTGVRSAGGTLTKGKNEFGCIGNQHKHATQNSEQ